MALSFDNIEKLVRRKMNRLQLSAFLVDIESKFSKQRGLYIEEEERDFEIEF